MVHIILKLIKSVTLTVDCMLNYNNKYHMFKLLVVICEGGYSMNAYRFYKQQWDSLGLSWHHVLHPLILYLRISQHSKHFNSTLCVSTVITYHTLLLFYLPKPQKSTNNNSILCVSAVITYQTLLFFTYSYPSILQTTMASFMSQLSSQITPHSPR